MKNGWLLFGSVLAFFILVVVMFLVPPVESGPLWMYVVFILLYLFFLGLAVFGCKLFFMLRAKLNPAKRGNIEKKSLRYGAIVAILPVLLIVMRTNGALNLFSVLASLFAVSLLCFMTCHTKV